MAINSGKGKTNVAQASKPSASIPKETGSSNVVALKGKIQNLSSGKGASSLPGVSLGTTHGNHDVSHPVKGGNSHKFSKQSY